MQKIKLSGYPEEIGFQHGRMLSDQIHRNIRFYKSIFQSNLLEESKVLELAKSFKRQINDFNPNYIIEIDHIAEGAEVSESLWLYALNSRTELALTVYTNECTAVVFPRPNLIGQTWDWAQHLESNSVIMEIEFPSGHRILQLTEAGIIGKIGLNNKGLGITLNLLRTVNLKLTGVPIHIVMRGVLESTNLEEAKDVIRRSGHGKASNIIMAQAGQAVNVEFAGDQTFYYKIKDLVYVHTNHSLHALKPVQIVDISYDDSFSRYTTAVKLLQRVDDYSAKALISILSDQTNNLNPILAPYEPHSIHEMGNCGTVATVVMDLENRTMMVRDGNPASKMFSMNVFVEYHLNG